jgi:hypothetical protein
MGRRKGIPGLSFSWKRALGVSAAKGKLSRQIGIPLSRQGRQRKAGAAMGCCAPAIILVLGGAVVVGALLTATGAVWAHSGRLDKNGCHTNRKTGEHHCHRAPASVPPKASVAPEFQPNARRQMLSPAKETCYANCSAARAAGAAPIHAGEAG